MHVATAQEWIHSLGREGADCWNFKSKIGHCNDGYPSLIECILTWFITSYTTSWTLWLVY